MGANDPSDVIFIHIYMTFTPRFVPVFSLKIYSGVLYCTEIFTYALLLTFSRFV